MKYFHAPLPTFYFQHTANVYSFDTNLNTNPTTAEGLLYTSIPCWGYRDVNTFEQTLLGGHSQGRWRVMFPLSFSGSAVTLKTSYVIVLTADDGVQRRLTIESIEKYSSTHIEVVANEDESSRQ